MIKTTVSSFFEALRRDDRSAFQRLTTSSFYCFDGGKRFAGVELFEAVRASHSRGMQLNWNIDEIDVHVGRDIAWAAWENIGSAGVTGQLKPVIWLESAVLVRQSGTWKITFLHSTRTVARDVSQSWRIGKSPRSNLRIRDDAP